MMTEFAFRFVRLACRLLPVVACTIAFPARGDEVELGGRRFTVAEGFTIEIAAVPPLIERPVTFDFDERGRLYVAESSGTNDPVEKQLADRPHRILRLEDTDADGQFDKRTVFADKMMFPAGTLWHNGSLFVSAPPHIWKLTDQDDDGVAEQREIWFDGKTLTGCANDLHGPYLGPDGQIYWCKGAFAEQTYERVGKPEFKTRAAHIFRRNASGSGVVEAVMTGGMDNPVDVVFMPNGDRIFTTTFLVHPGGGQRDGLIHALPGAIYGKVHDPIFDPVHKWTNPETMPVLVNLGPAAPCGLTRYESAVFGEEYRDNLFTCLFNMHKLTRHVLRERGATYEAGTEDFLTSSDLDFHPTDVIEDADGSLLVANTGGWYKLCCPSSQLHKPEVPGAIYRIRKVGHQRVADPRGIATFAATKDEGLIGLLDDPRPAVRRSALARLVASHPEADRLRAAMGASSERDRNLLWTAHQIDDLTMRAMVRDALSAPDPSVRQVALQSVGIWRDREAIEGVLRLLRSGSDFDRRLAAEAAGRLGDPVAVPALLQAASRPNDRALEHSLIYALIEINDPAANAAGLALEQPSARGAAMVALDQTAASDRLEPVQLAAWMTGENESLARSASWVIGRHSEWGDALVTVFRKRLLEDSSTSQERAALAQQLARIAAAPLIQQMLATTAADPERSDEVRATALDAMNRSELRQLPEAWSTAITRLISESPMKPSLVERSLGLVRGRKPEPQILGVLTESFTRLGADVRQPNALRLAALAAIPTERFALDDQTVRYLTDRLGNDPLMTTRLAAADIATRAALRDSQLLELCRSVANLGPLELARVLPAFASSSDERVGRALLSALKNAPAGGSVRPEQLRQATEKYPITLRTQAEEWLASFDTSAASQTKRLEELLQQLPTGDVRRGQAVFNGAKGACATCHAIGYLGGNVGPDLTRIGSVRNERDLLEAIVSPSASFVRSFEPVTVATRDGRIFSGIVKKDSADEVTLVVGADKEERIARSEIDEIRPGSVSVMPAGLDQQLGLQELADLVAFLRACK
jgi:putative membrane-bound dehydrogenase-like protein